MLSLRKRQRRLTPSPTIAAKHLETKRSSIEGVDIEVVDVDLVSDGVGIAKTIGIHSSIIDFPKDLRQAGYSARLSARASMRS